MPLYRLINLIHTNNDIHYIIGQIILMHYIIKKHYLKQDYEEKE